MMAKRFSVLHGPYVMSVSGVVEHRGNGWSNIDIKLKSYDFGLWWGVAPNSFACCIKVPRGRGNIICEHVVLLGLKLFRQLRVLILSALPVL